VPTFEDRECHVVSVKNPHGRILGFPDRNNKLIVGIYKLDLGNLGEGALRKLTWNLPIV
jgi:hypothetical protein